MASFSFRLSSLYFCLSSLCLSFSSSRLDGFVQFPFVLFVFLFVESLSFVFLFSIGWLRSVSVCPLCIFVCRVFVFRFPLLDWMASFSFRLSSLYFCLSSLCLSFS